MCDFRADLHCHSTCSDGTYRPDQLIDLALEKKLQGLSITDHDSVEAYGKEVLAKARKVGLRLLSGVEFSCLYRGHSIHILGYGFQLNHEGIMRLCLKHKKRRFDRNQAMINLLQDSNIPISLEDLEAHFQRPLDKMGRPHIARWMVERGIVPHLKKAFDVYLGEGKKAFYVGDGVSVEETIQVIHGAKGKAILAHPHLYSKPSIVDALMKMPFEGVEVYYANMPFNVELKWLRKARERRWIATGGSDFHGLVKPHIQMGASWVNEETFNLLDPLLST